MPDVSVYRRPLLVIVGGVFLAVTLLIPGARDAAASHTCVPTDPDSDGDGLPNSCDPNSLNPDWDGDGFEDSLEIYVGTGPGNRCSFPADLDGSGTISGGDVFVLFPYWLATPKDPQWPQRYDIDGNEQISGGDVFTTFPVWLQMCATPWYFPGTITVQLRSGTLHDVFAPMWFSNLGNVIVSSDPEAPGIPACDEVKRSADHWTNLTDFSFSVGLTGNCSTTSDVRVIIEWFNLPSGVLGLTAKWTKPFRLCRETDPCHFAHWAKVFLNVNNPAMISDSNVRHLTMAHEFGHVAGQGDSGFPEVCGAMPWTLMINPGDCLFQWNLHWPRPSDILFANVKY